MRHGPLNVPDEGTFQNVISLPTHPLACVLSARQEQQRVLQCPLSMSKQPWYAGSACGAADREEDLQRQRQEAAAGAPL